MHVEKFKTNLLTSTYHLPSTEIILVKDLTLTNKKTNKSDLHLGKSKEWVCAVWHWASVTEQKPVQTCRFTFRSASLITASIGTNVAKRPKMGPF